MRPETQIVLVLVLSTWSISVMSTVATALLARKPSQRADARKVLDYLLQFRKPSIRE